MNTVLRLLRPGDWIVLALSLTLAGASMDHFWLHAVAGERLVVKQGGAVYLDASLSHDLEFAVPGPLGLTRIQVAHHRARVRSDPGPRQLCVRQGWISRAGEAAICLPNQVSMEIVGSAPVYDSLNY